VRRACRRHRRGEPEVCPVGPITFAYSHRGLTLVDTTRIKVFREVITHGSFTAAAAALHISQPAVSQHIAKLEQ